MTRFSNMDISVVVSVVLSDDSRQKLEAITNVNQLTPSNPMNFIINYESPAQQNNLTIEFKLICDPGSHGNKDNKY